MVGDLIKLFAGHPKGGMIVNFHAGEIIRSGHKIHREIGIYIPEIRVYILGR